MISKLHAVRSPPYRSCGAKAHTMLCHPHSRPDEEAGRSAHLTCPIAAALMANADDLLAEAPQIEHVDVLGAKLPH